MKTNKDFGLTSVKELTLKTVFYIYAEETKEKKKETGRRFDSSLAN